MSNAQIEKIIAALLIAMFIGISLFSIMNFSTWHDESYSATLIEGSYSDIIRRTALDVHPPLYYIVLRGWSDVFGNSLFALRAMSLITMTGAIMIAWRLLRRQFGVRAGLYALAGMAVGPFLIRYSQEVRMYGLGALLAMSATYLVWRLYSEEMSSLKTWIFTAIYIVLASMALYTHYFLAFMIMAHAFFVVQPTIRNLKPKSLIKALRKLPRHWWAAFTLPLASLLLWLPAIIAQFREVHGSFWIGHIKVETLSSTVLNFFLFRQQWELSAWTAVLGLATLTGVVLILWRWYRRRLQPAELRHARRLSAVLLFVPMGMLVLISLPPLQPAYQDRYISFYAPILYGIFAICLAHWTTTNKGWFGRIPVAIMILSVGWGVINVSTLGNNQGWRPEPHFTVNEIASYADSLSPKTPVVSTTLWTFLDAHVTLGTTREVLLYAPDGVGKYGNGSVVYDREELLIDDLAEINSDKVWVLNEAGRQDIEVPADWQKLNNFQNGYARITLYKIEE